MEIIDQQQPKHWGSYDGVDHGFDSRAQSPISRPVQTYPYEQLRGPGVDITEPVAMDPTASVPIDWAAAVQPETRGALQYVRSELQPGLMQALRATSFHSVGGNGSRGTVVPHLSMTWLAWADQALAAGNAVLVDIGSATAAQPLFDILGQPDAVAAMAFAGGPCAIVAIPPGIDALAQQAAAQPQTLPGMPPAPSGATSWKRVALGVSLVGGGLLLVAGIAYPGAARSKR